jgi:zinc D-Ala-D-Ala carboxypeptidase
LGFGRGRAVHERTKHLSPLPPIKMANLTEHFTVEELIHTDTGLPNDPPMAVAGNLLRLAEVLEQVRKLVGPIRINSGYRSDAVNRAVGGVSTSAHLYGRAADLFPLAVSPAVLFDLVRISPIPFDQLIYEKHKSDWVHIGIAAQGEEPRFEVLTARPDDHGRMVYAHV